ncbi:MAG TPA: orotate phosphoribosyltransferase [Gemmatimonadales bacterium]|nr:orotate phosphoribosyltransferase [Gemmatimonadales bacterium]
MNSSSDYYYLRTTLKDLLLMRSVRRGDFVLASGRRSSFYIDARLTTMSGDGLAVIGGLGLDRMAVRGWTPRAVGGLTLGADPVAYALALTARRRGQLLDAFTVRKQPKDHGTGKRIEGCFSPGISVVVVEDVLTTGSSAREAISAVEREGGHVLGVMAVVDRQEGGREAVESAGYRVEAFLTASDLGLESGT